MFRGILVLLGMLGKITGLDNSRTIPRSPLAPPQKSPPPWRPSDTLIIVNPSPERRRLTKVRPGVFVAQNAYAPLMPGEKIDYFASSPLFAPGGALNPNN